MSLLGLVLPIKGSGRDTKSNDTDPIGLDNKKTTIKLSHHIYYNNYYCYYYCHFH